MCASPSSRRKAGPESRADCAGRCTASAVWHEWVSLRMCVSLVTGRTASVSVRKATWTCLASKKANIFVGDGRVGDVIFLWTRRRGSLSGFGRATKPPNVSFGCVEKVRIDGVHATAEVLRIDVFVLSRPGVNLLYQLQSLIRFYR